MKYKKLFQMMISLVMIANVISFSALSASADYVDSSKNEILSQADISNDYVSYFNAHINFLDLETGKAIENIEARFVEYSADPSLGYEAELISVIAEWNTSDVNTYSIENIGFTAGHYYCVEVDQLPEGYSLGKKSSVSYGVHTTQNLKGDIDYTIEIANEPPFVPNEYPMEGNRSSSIAVYERVSMEPLEGIEAELVIMDEEYNVTSVIGTWNTSDYEAYPFELPYYFEDSASRAIIGVRVLNMPENMVYSSNVSKEPDFNGYDVFTFTPMDYQIDVDLGFINESHDYILYLRDMNEEFNPVSTAISDNKTTTTTTTTTTITTSASTTENSTTTVSSATEIVATSITTASTETLTTTTTVTELTTTSVPTTSITTTTTNNIPESLPQTGDPGGCRMLISLAVLLTSFGAASMITSKNTMN